MTSTKREIEQRHLKPSQEAIRIAGREGLTIRLENGQVMTLSDEFLNDLIMGIMCQFAGEGRCAISRIIDQSSDQIEQLRKIISENPAMPDNIKEKYLMRILEISQRAEKEPDLARIDAIISVQKNGPIIRR